jgi:hypothetical protein
VYRSSRGTTPFILNLGTNLPGKKPQRGLDVFEQDKNLLLLPRFEPQTAEAVGQSLNHNTVELAYNVMKGTE